MAVAWYEVKAWKVTRPDGTNFVGTKPTHPYTWELWTVHKDNGTTVQVPQNVRRKYDGLVLGISLAYDKVYDGVNDATLPDVALLRVEYPDGAEPPLEAEDYIAHLNTAAKWSAAMTQYPALKYRFADQPLFPAE